MHACTNSTFSALQSELSCGSVSTSFFRASGVMVLLNAGQGVSWAYLDSEEKRPAPHEEQA